MTTINTCDQCHSESGLCRSHEIEKVKKETEEKTLRMVVKDIIPTVINFAYVCEENETYIKTLSQALYGVKILIYARIIELGYLPI